VVEARFIEVALPLDFAAEFAERGLGVGLDEEAEASFDYGFLSGGSGAAHRLIYEVIVEFDVGAHGLTSMCMDSRFVCIGQEFQIMQTRIFS
jgi:hypothetical protein